MATVKKTMKKSAPKKAMMKKSPMQPSVGGPGAMGAGSMMKKGGKVKMKMGGMMKKAKMGVTTTTETTKKPKYENSPFTNMMKERQSAKTPVGMTMKELKMKYPNVDTGKAGDVRGTEMNSGAPKKVLQQYNDTYNAFDKKFKGGPAKNKMGGILTPSKKSVGKTIGKLNKAKSGSKMSKKK